MSAALDPFEGAAKPRLTPAQAVADAIAELQESSAASTEVLDDRGRRAATFLYLRYADLARGVVARIIGPADADDVVHDIFLALPRTILQYRNGGFGGWLRQVAVRAALMRLRRGRRIDYVVEVPELPTADERHSVDDRAALRRAIGELPVSLREVVVLRYFMELSHAEIGGILDITCSASEVRLCRALKQLRVQLLQRDQAGAARSR